MSESVLDRGIVVFVMVELCSWIVVVSLKVKVDDTRVDEVVSDTGTDVTGSVVTLTVGGVEEFTLTITSTSENASRKQSATDGTQLPLLARMSVLMTFGSRVAVSFTTKSMAKLTTILPSLQK